MKSIKPGRGPSAMHMVSSIFAALFGVFWIAVAISIGAVIMVPFGILFIGVAITQAVYHYRNTTEKDRYSLFDITDNTEESDPLQQRFGDESSQVEADIGNTAASPSEETTHARYCPYCGTKAENEYVFCENCGKKLP